MYVDTAPGVQTNQRGDACAGRRTKDGPGERQVMFTEHVFGDAQS